MYKVGERNSTGKDYILRSILKEPENEAFVQWGDEQPKLALIATILTIIYTSDGILSEGVNIYHPFILHLT